MPEETKKVVEYPVKLAIFKKGVDIVLELTLDKKLEQFFSDLSAGEQATSDNWQGKTGKPLNFYRTNDNYDKMYRVLQRLGIDCYDDFGTSRLMSSGRINLAVLRTVGTSLGVTLNISELLSVEELKDYVFRLGSAVKALYKEFIATTEIRATISLEL